MATTKPKIPPMEDAVQEKEMVDLSGMLWRFGDSETELSEGIFPNGPILKGLYQGYTFTEVASGAIAQFLITDADGTPWTVNGTVQLIKALSRVLEGAYVEIELLARSRTGKGYAVNQFAVRVEKGARLKNDNDAAKTWHFMNDPDALFAKLDSPSVALESEAREVPALTSG